MNNTLCNIGDISSERICEYIHSTCDKRYYFIAYQYYCSNAALLNVRLALLSAGIALYIPIFILLIGIILSNYILPSITNLTDVLQWKRDTLSYLLIPMMNGLPDVVNSYLMIKSNSINLIMGQVLGASLITFTIIVGSISILRPFCVRGKMGILTGYLFACIMILVLSYTLLDGQITITECLILSTLYPAQITIAYFDRSTVNEITDLERAFRKDQATEVSLLIQNQERFELIDSPTIHTIYLRKFERLLAIMSNIVDRLLFLFIPVSTTTVADPETEAKNFKLYLMSNTWYHIWLTAISATIFNESTLKLPLAVLQYFIGSAICAVKVIPLFMNSSACATLMDIVCITNSLTVMAFIMKMLICLMKNGGIMWDISDYVMGLLVFSVASSLNDILMNILIALSHSPCLGIKSCMSSCCLLILVGIGFNGFCDLLLKHFTPTEAPSLLSLPVTLTSELYVSLLALNLTVLSTMAYLIYLQWHFNKSLGLWLIAIWFTANGTCILLEII